MFTVYSYTYTCAGFRDFILRGNVVDLAVAIVVGGAFKDLVDAFVAAFITPLIGMIGTGNSNQLYFVVLGSKFQYGLFINALISFLIICILIYFLVVVPLMSLMRRVYPNLAFLRSCPECCMDDLPGTATRCKYCCSSLPPLPKDSSSNPEDEEVVIQGSGEEMGSASKIDVGKV